ncbi:hypothetical protein KAW18_01550 [candidate division WOR-3 bacterium]|nr:hypothetical protein [candidate division WOR-3 bacterium]
MAMVAVNSFLILGLIVVMALSLMGIMVVLIMLYKYPQARAILKAGMTGRPLVLIHTTLRGVEFLTPKRKGDKKEGMPMYDIPQHNVKFIPDAAITESSRGIKIINYYSKYAMATSPKVVAAIRTIKHILAENDWEAMWKDLPNPKIFNRYDMIMQLRPDEIEDKELAKKIEKVQHELKTAFIEDGQFIFSAVDEYIRTPALMAAHLDGTISVIEKRAWERMKGLEVPKIFPYVIICIMLLMGSAIAYKIVVG